MDDIVQISIVDDDASIRRALGRLFKSAGYFVEAFESAETFLNSPNAHKTSCLVLDLHLPVQSGLQLQHDLNLADRRFPVVFMTAFDDDQLRAKAFEAGAVEFLRKPLDCDRLLDVIRAALSRSD